MIYYAICLKFLSSFFVVQKVSQNFRLFSTRLLIKWFLIKKTCSSKRFLNFRLSGTRLLIKWFLIKRTCSSKSILNFRLSGTRLRIK